MTLPFRTAILMLAALTGSSVAPAQVSNRVSNPSEPLIFTRSAALPMRTALQPIPASVTLPATATTAEPLDAVAEVDSDTPAVDPSASLATKVAQLRGSDPGSRELECLAAGIYFEAKSEPLAGQLAVGHVIANRAESGRFASSYCGVLFQRGQFSFVRGKSWPAIAKAGRQWRNAVAVAKIVHRDLHISGVPRALFFHAKRVSPKWRMTRVGSIGNHIFYR